jgi:hypothetical protein
MGTFAANERAPASAAHLVVRHVKTHVMAHDLGSVKHGV